MTLVRNAQPKPIRGAHRLAQKHLRQARKTAEDTAMQAAKRRDHHKCRWPHQTREEAERCRLFQPEAAHLTHRGMGGNPKGDRTVLELLLTLGFPCHRDPTNSLDAKDRRVRFLTDRKASGPVAFEVKRGRQWIEVGREISVGVLQ